MLNNLHRITTSLQSNFPHFHKDQLVDFERRLLLKIGFHIIPQATPSAFVRFMLKLWPATAGPISHTDVLMMADLLIGLFWSGKELLAHTSDDPMKHVPHQSFHDQLLLMITTSLLPRSRMLVL